MTHKDFIRFFRDDEQINLLSVEDRVEVLGTIMKGSDDITTVEVNKIVRNYASNIEIVEEANKWLYDADDLMDFLNDESKLNQLTREERKEIFQSCLSGNSDITACLFESLFDIYDIEGYDALITLDYLHKPHKVEVIATNEQEEQQLNTYSFESEKEAEAFKKGMELATKGWKMNSNK